MPRRDAISEKRKEQLKVENDQLQKLMLQARSSVRRSSLKDTETENFFPEDRTAVVEESATNEAPNTNVLFDGNNITAATEEQEISEEKPVVLGHETPVENTTAPKILLTEKDLFPEENNVPAAPRQDVFPIEKHFEKVTGQMKPLTEKDLFPEETRRTASPQQPEKSRTINVILPAENKATAIAIPGNRYSREKVEPEDNYAELPGSVYEPVPQIEREPVVNRTQQRKVQKDRSSGMTTYIIMLAAALLAGFGGYYFYYKNITGSQTAVKQNKETTPETDSRTPQATPESMVNTEPGELKKSGAVKTATAAAEDDEALKKNPAKSPSKPIVATTGAESTTTASNGATAKYKVISKAYFHDEPDESTRRKAFIIHWNNAVLTPGEERNGFVYVIFTNHLGQTSKGWLRKKDLDRLN